jgi:hypothetical protein
MTINERFVKLSSRVPFPEDIKLGQDIQVTIGGETQLSHYLFNCTKTEDLDNQDGTINRIYILKSLIE